MKRQQEPFYYVFVSFSAYLAVSGGNVGIGTTAPGAKLEVKDAGGSGIRFDVSTPGIVRFIVDGVAAAEMTPG